MRYGLLGGVSQNLFAMAIVLFPFRRGYRFIVIFLVALSFVLGMLSGFRSSLIIIVGVLVVHILLQERSRRASGDRSVTACLRWR